MRLHTTRLVWLAFASALALGCAGVKSCGGTASQGAEAQASSETKAAANTKGFSPGPSCDSCREKMCGPDNNSEGVNLVASCFEAPEPRFVPHPDANFARDCRAAVECAFEHDCGYNPALGPAHCYCGSRSLDDCVKNGPAADAPCVAQWQAATRSKNNGEIMERFSLPDYPSGWAFNLIECDRDRCGARSEVGRCTP